MRDGYLKANGLRTYFEVHGAEVDPATTPLVLLHGGLLTIDLNFAPLLPALAATRTVIAVELQGHGHTGDSDRAFTLRNLAADVISVLDHLHVPRADVFGFSLGGLVATQMLVDHPRRLAKAVLASTHFHQDGYYDEIRDPSLSAGSDRLPTADDFAEMRAAYQAVAPVPDNFDYFAGKASAAVAAFGGWPEEVLSRMAVPTLVVVGDHDFVRVEHSLALSRLVRQGQLAVLPGTTHMDICRRAELLVPMLDRFLGP